MTDFEYEGVTRKVYGEGAWFVPVCQTCGRFVKAFDTINFDAQEQPIDEPNAFCSKCGPIKMPFEGYYE